MPFITLKTIDQRVSRINSFLNHEVAVSPARFESLLLQVMGPDVGMCTVTACAEAACIFHLVELSLTDHVC
jgi:hypothetical protein